MKHIQDLIEVALYLKQFQTTKQLSKRIGKPYTTIHNNLEKLYEKGNIIRVTLHRANNRGRPKVMHYLLDEL